ncbi:MAG: type II secretion system F family protein [Gemmatimonadaceae bacterium]|nr:type II secretion system F family protein [Gemmatimonadaceae bacterium]
MPTFAYRTITATGTRATGSVAAPDAEALRAELEARGLTVISVEPRTVSWTGSTVSAAALEDAMRSVAALLAAGLPIARALDTTASAAPPALAAMLGDVRGRVERGEAIADACAAQTGLLSAAALGVLRAGERAGALDTAFARVAEQLERSSALRSRLLSAAIYPMILLVAGGAAVFVLLLFVLPRFADLLGGADAPLPRSTALLLAAANAARSAAWAAPFALAVIAAAVMWLRISAAGRLAWAQLLVATPGVGALRRDLLASETAGLLAMLLRGGTPLLAALDDTARSLSDPLARAAVDNARERVRTGASLHDGLRSETVFPPLFSTLVATGEQAARVSEFLDRAAVLFATRTTRRLERLIALAEPAMIIVMGVLVGGVALSLLQAIYAMNPAALR